MGKRPEYVKCKNCVYWDPSDDEGGEGWCCRYPQELFEKYNLNEKGEISHAYKPDIAFCGEFRREWPKDA